MCNDYEMLREPNNYCNEERQYMAPDGGFTPQGDAIQLNKIRTIYRIALKNGHDSVVLGGFGSVVNKLPCDAVADQFRRVLDEPEFKGRFRAVERKLFMRIHPSFGCYCHARQQRRHVKRKVCDSVLHL